MANEVLQIDLNGASVDVLPQLPGIGPALAQRIVAARPFESVDDLVRVRGIGKETLARLRPFVGVSASDRGPPAAGPQAQSTPEEGGSASPAQVDSDGGLSALPAEDAGAEGVEWTFKARAAETVPLRVPEPKPVEEVNEMEEHETVLKSDQVDAVQADDSGVEAVEAKVPEREALETEVIETDAVSWEDEPISGLEEEVPFIEEDISFEDQDIPIPDEDILFEDQDIPIPDEDILFEDQDIPIPDEDILFEDQDIPIPDEDIPGMDVAGVAEAAPKRKPPVVTRGRMLWMVLLSVVLATLLATLLSLSLLSYLNGGQLQYVTPARFGELSTRAEGLEAQAGVLAQDVEGLRKRLDNLEALSGRLDVVEQANEQMQADLEDTAGKVEKLTAQASDLATQSATLARQAEEVAARVSTLEEQGDRAQAFLEGLAELMNTLFPSEASKQ